MSNHDQPGNQAFRTVVNGLVELHWLIRDGKGDSPEAEAIRDALDSPLRMLSKAEKDHIQLFSENLYKLNDQIDAN